MEGIYAEYCIWYKEMRRLGIFSFYDKDGIVDSYIEFLLEDITKCLIDLVIVCNGKLSEEGRKKLNRYSNEIFVRDNSGYDIMAYKLALTQYCGWDKVENYDELILFNDTFFGPLISFEDIFSQMSNRASDFWGITKYEKFFSLATGRIAPTHIQSYFMVFRKTIIKNINYQEYWNKFDSTNWNLGQVIQEHEIFLTSKLEEWGFTWDTFVHSAELESDKPENNYNICAHDSYRLIKDFKCPIIKKKNFFSKDLSSSLNENTNKALEYINLMLHYNVDLIWENILRIYNIYDIKKALNLEYIISDKMVVENKLPKVGILIFINYFSDYMRTYLNNIPTNVDIYIASYTDLSIYSDVNISERIKVVNNCKNLFDLIKKYKNVFIKYQYMCWIIDADFDKNNKAEVVLQSRRNSMWENTLKSVHYIYAVVERFEKEKRLGILASPWTYHNKYFSAIGNEWGEKFNQIKKILDSWNINVPIACDVPCILMNSAFWCKMSAVQLVLEKIETINIGDDIDSQIEILMRILPYISQSAGYYTATLMSENYAGIEISNLSYMLRGLTNKYRLNCSAETYNQILEESGLLSFCQEYRYILIYGAGNRAAKAARLITEKAISFEGFIVSDGQPKPEEKLGHKVFYLSEITYSKEDVGIIVAMLDRNRTVVLPLLREKNFDNIYLF